MKLTKELAELESMEFSEVKAEALQNPDVTKLALAILSYWPLVRLALKALKIFTGKKMDEKIDQIIEDGNAVKL